MTHQPELFAEPPVAPALQQRLVAAYARRLLVEKPVRGLQDGQPGREEFAQMLAVRDVTRLVAALRDDGVRLVEERA